MFDAGMMGAKPSVHFCVFCESIEVGSSKWDAGRWVSGLLCISVFSVRA